MDKEVISVIAQLLSSMKDAMKKLEEAEKSKNNELATIAKREILNFQNEIKKLL